MRFDVALNQFTVRDDVTIGEEQQRRLCFAYAKIARLAAEVP